tara:strand:+ start:781 stop:960 length:180 start_codon:yes stop_codon:yes gene_type:complete
MITIEPFCEGINIGWYVMHNRICIDIIMANDLAKILKEENRICIDALYDQIHQKRSEEE